MTADFVNMSGIYKKRRGSPQPRSVLIEGKPRAGKTTLCRKLAYDWATGKQEDKDCIPTFQTVLSMNCRDMKSDLWETIDYQLFSEDVDGQEKTRFFIFITQNRTNVLLILDGLDEVAESKLQMISKIIKGNERGACRLIATARRDVGIKVREHYDTLLKIKGVTEANVVAFIFKYLQESEDKAKKILSELTRDKNFKGMAASPLTIALLYHVFDSRK